MVHYAGERTGVKLNLISKCKNLSNIYHAGDSKVTDTRIFLPARKPSSIEMVSKIKGDINGKALRRKMSRSLQKTNTGKHEDKYR